MVYDESNEICRYNVFMPSDFLSKATPSERLMALYLKRHQPLIRLFLRFSGSIDKNALEEAINRSIKAAPLVNSAYDFAHHRWNRESFSGADIVTEIPVANASLESLSPYILSNISFSTGPQIKVFLFRSDEGDSLCFLASHLAFDGISLKRYAFLVAKLYSSVLTDTNEDLTSGYSLERGFKQVLNTLSFRQKCSLLILPKKQAQPSIELSLSGLEKANFVILETIEEEDFAEISLKAKAANATINDVVMTAYARALAKTLGIRDIDLPCPVSFLKRLPNPDKSAFLNLTGGYHFHLRLEPTDDFLTSLSKTSAEMSEEKKSMDSLKGPFILGKVFSCLPDSLAQKLVYKIAPPPFISYTNLGMMDSKSLTFGDIVPEEAYFLTAVKKAPSFQLSISTYEGTLYLSSCFCGSEEDKIYLSKLLNAVKTELQSFAASSKE